MYKCGCARDEDDDTVWVKVDPPPREIRRGKEGGPQPAALDRIGGEGEGGDTQ